MVQKAGEGASAGQLRRRRGRPRSFDPDLALDQIRAVFWDAGYSGTSLDDLAAATGLNRPSLYGAFGDKATLYLAALEKTRQEINAALAAALAPEEPLRQALGRVYAAAASVYARGEAGQRGCFLIGTAVTEAVAGPKVRRLLATALGEIDAAFETRIRRAQATGELAAGTDAAGLAKLATATMNGMAVRARAGATRESLEALGQSLIDLICGPA